jgi:D-glycero-alpha-D-manno-heptose-7-phosphate kinase
VGSQDQVSVAHGGLNHIVFHQSGEITVRPVTISPERCAELNSHLMLFYTGVKRTASDVAASYTENLEGRKRQLRIMKDLVEESIAILSGKYPIQDFGTLLNEGWTVKRSLSSVVTNPDVEAVYNKAQAAGALGGKLLGAGGGGFMALFVEPERQEAVRNALSDLIHVPFSFEFSGAQIVFFEPEKHYDQVEESRSGRVLRPFRELGGISTSFEAA